MNEIKNKILLVGDKFMPEMHFRQPEFTQSACGPFTKNKERTEKFKKSGYLRFIYQNELDKVFFQHDMTYGGFKEFTRRITSQKVLHEKAFNVAKNSTHDGYYQLKNYINHLLEHLKNEKYAHFLMIPQ